MMAERNIATATELQRLLEKSGFQITSSQLTRIIKERPERISTELLDHLMEVLKCDIGDLLRSDSTEWDGGAARGETSSESKAPANPKKPRVRREPTDLKPDENLTGPKVTAFPIPPRK
jgi:DNA-binding Xre family transcriptional regulator